MYATLGSVTFEELIALEADTAFVALVARVAKSASSA